MTLLNFFVQDMNTSLDLTHDQEIHAFAIVSAQAPSFRTSDVLDEIGREAIQNGIWVIFLQYVVDIMQCSRETALIYQKRGIQTT